MRTNRGQPASASTYDLTSPSFTATGAANTCQYTSQEFADFANTLGLRRSLGRTGTCYDNAWAESFNGTLKNEGVNRTVYPTKEHARIDLTAYIELRYNEKRLHSTLGYITPNEAQRNWLQEHQAV